MLTPGVRTDTSAAAGTDLDNAASSAFGGQAYLQVTAFTGTDVTITLKHSTDNSTYTSLIAFTAGDRRAVHAADQSCQQHDDGEPSTWRWSRPRPAASPAPRSPWSLTGIPIAGTVF